MSETTGPTRDIFDAGGRGLRHESLRRANEKAVLTIVGFNSGVSNAEIARLSGLAPQTVSAILVTLERDGLIRRGPVLRGKRGQPATPILLNETGAFGIGVEIGWRHLDVALINFRADVLGERHVDYAYPDARTIFDTIASLTEELMALLPDGGRSRLLDLGIAMPGRLAENLDLLNAPAEQAQLWKALDPVWEIGHRTGLDVSVLNDGNAACWAELIALPRPRPANVLYFLVSHYVAAGVVGNGALLEGKAGNAANMGSMLVQLDQDGPLQTHYIASVSALEQQLQAAGKMLGGVSWRGWDGRDAESELDTWLQRSARALAHTVFNTVTVIDSPLLVIDTVLDQAITEQLAERLRVELASLPVRHFQPPEVVTGTHGRLAPSIGAAELPMFRRYF